MRLLLENEGYQVNRYEYPPGTYFAPHRHADDKKDGVLQGKLLVRWEGGEAVLEEGDMLEIPAGTSHSAQVLGQTTVLSLDATRPSRASATRRNQENPLT